MGWTALVIGGANTDIIGFPDASLLPHDSNPGHVRIGHGGVGRNIAENLARLGVEVDLITAVGDDPAGRALLDACEEAGVSTARTLVVPGATSSSYLAIMDSRHDLEVGINDMRVLEMLDAAHLESVAAVHPTPDIVVLDANLSRPAIEAAARLWSASCLLLDPVSAPKARKAAGILGRLEVLKANVLEAAELSGVHIDSPATLEVGVERLLTIGARRVFVSRGAEGVYCAQGADRVSVKAPDVNIANTTGAGDAFAAGLAYATLAGKTLEEAARFASAVAGITLVTERTVSDELTVESASMLAEGSGR